MGEGTGGGASGRRGFKYQDKAAAYYFITDRPSFISDDFRPAEVYVEEYDSDFAYFIRVDEPEVEHFFEVKYRGSGEIKWSEFQKITAGLGDILKKHSDPDKPSYFHLISNVDIADKPTEVIDISQGLRDDRHQWTAVKTRYKRPLFNPIQSEADLEDWQLEKLIKGLYFHKHTEDALEDGLMEYLRKCTPRKPLEVYKILKEELSGLDTGILSRDYIERETEVTLRKKNDSTTSASKSTAELRAEVENISTKYESSETGVSEIMADKETVKEYGERVAEEKEGQKNVIESQTVSVDEEFEERIELAKTVNKSDYSIGSQTSELLNLGVDRSSTDGDQDD